MQETLKAINIVMNGSKHDIPEGTTLEELIMRLKLKEKAIVLELNRKIIEKSAYPTVCLKDSDIVEIVHFVGGG